MAKNRAGIEVFNGFQIKYPEYTVITPHTLKEFNIRTLTVSEEEALKASMLTPSKLASHLNKVIFDCLTKKPDDIKTYEDFLTKLSIKDRDALMFGLYHATYKDIQNYDVECSNCNTTTSVKVNYEKSLRVTLWPKNSKEECLKKEIAVPLEIASNVTAIVKQPTLFQEDTLMTNSTFASDDVRDLQLQILIIDRFEVDEGGPDKVVYSDRDNIYEGYCTLPSNDRKLIEKAYTENFGQYGCDIASKVVCPRCGHETTITIDLVRQFFRAMYQ